jgi:hypothetical protein
MNRILGQQAEQDSQAEPAEQADQLENARPRKRQKRPNADDEQGDARPGRQTKACANCRKLKVKCDFVDNETTNCSRCVRLGLLCLRETRSWTSGDDAVWYVRMY